MFLPQFVRAYICIKYLCAFSLERFSIERHRV